MSEDWDGVDHLNVSEGARFSCGRTRVIHAEEAVEDSMAAFFEPKDLHYVPLDEIIHIPRRV